MLKGFLLAAGFGTRLWPLSDVRPKPAFPYRGTPLIVHAAELLIRHGVRELWVNTHHLPEAIHAALEPLRTRADVALHVVHEPDILGTAGALVNLRRELAGATVVVMNAKVVTDIALSEVIAAAKAPVTMVCVANRKREKFTHVRFSAEGALEGFDNDLSRVEAPFLFTGIQVLAPSFFDFLPGPGFSDTIKDVYPKILASGGRITVHVSNDAWAEFSTLARYRDLHAGGFIDPRAQVAPSASVVGSVVWEHAEIGPEVALSGCIVADGVRLPAGFRGENSAIIRADRVREPRDARRVGDLLIAPIT